MGKFLRFTTSIGSIVERPCRSQVHQVQDPRFCSPQRYQATHCSGSRNLLPEFFQEAFFGDKNASRANHEREHEEPAGGTQGFRMQEGEHRESTPNSILAQMTDILVCCRHVVNVDPTGRRHSVMSAIFWLSVSCQGIVSPTHFPTCR